MSEPTVVCVLGMHRSGTSLVAHVLYALGLDLGPPEHLMPASSANQAGHWESIPLQEINDEILLRLGGNWAEPPEFEMGWERNPALDELRQRACEVIEADFSGSECWGFKDPRASLTLPFWQSILPPMRYVICLRNPMDVAFSLAAREYEPLPFEQGAELWLTYVRSALAATAGHPLQVVFYEDLMAEPEPVVRQLAGFIGTDQSDVPEVAEAYTHAAIRVALSQTLQHHRTPVSNVVDSPRLPFYVKAVYLALRLFERGTESVGPETLGLLAAHAIDADRQRAGLERIVSERRDDLDRMMEARAEELARLMKARGEEHRRHEEVEAELKLTREELTRLREVAPDPASDSRNVPTTEASDGPDQPLIKEIRARALEVIPSGATVLVASKGDERLLQLNGSRGLHFPVGPDGRYLGWHPAGDTAVIAQLEAMRASGADHLVVPATTLWWLDHYQGLRRHLEDRYVSLLEDECCAIYQLRGGGDSASTAPITTLKRAIATLRIRSGHDPSVLDWRTHLGIAAHLPQVPVFVPPGEEDVLPYVAKSADIVILASTAGARLAEARRVAASAVIRIDPEFPEASELEWMSGLSGSWGENVSLALIPDPDEPGWEATIAAFSETLDGAFAGDLSVVGTAAVLERASERVPASGIRVQLIEIGAGASLAQRARAATEGSGDAVQIFVTGPAVPLPDWLPSMLTLFSRHQDAGVVGTRIVSRFGALEEAGGILAADGSRRRRGEGDQNPDRPEYCFVKRVDFCSPPLLATRSEVFRRNGGFDEGLGGPADAMVDFSLRAGQMGTPVYYQPQARVVKIGEANR